MSAKAKQVVTMPSGRPSLVATMAAKYGVDPDKMLETLKQTCFKGDGNKAVSNEQMMALLVVANEYDLNPWLKQIYAFSDKGGIVPVVGVDGWIRIINDHPELQSISFEYGQTEEDENGKTDPWIACTIERKDRTQPITIREYMSECYRNTGPWNSHPRRMLRHKALIQCGRIAFGLGGIYDEDEAGRIVDVTPQAGKPRTAAPQAIEAETVDPETGEIGRDIDQQIADEDEAGVRG